MSHSATETHVYEINVIKHREYESAYMNLRGGSINY